MYVIGIDVGSVTVKIVVLDSEGRKIESRYVRHYGHPLKVSLDLLKEAAGRYRQCSISVTGSAGKPIASALGIRPVNEIVAQSYAVRKLYPDVRTIIELGGEDSKLIILDEGRVVEFAMNSVCAAGTGSFLEQQAERLRMSIEEFSDVAVRSRRPSKVAGRCSVFAKSDMIHLQQIATPVEDIVAGLCFAVARNFKGTIAKGIDLKPPVAFQGGVAANQGMVRAFREIFALDDLLVPADFALMGAIGSALKAIDDGLVNALDIEALQSYVSSLTFSDKGYAPLVEANDTFFVRHGQGDQPSAASGGNGTGGSAPKTAYLGIDIGSISTNLAVIDEEGNILAKRYLMTAGRPIEAVQQGLREIREELADSVLIAGVGTTGSGRYMIADYVGADIVKNEITAQATAAAWINPQVDTIFEIGGQDSKYISLKDSVIVDFEMNKACAAGTGSFLEEQAEKLSISVKGEFAEAALRSEKPCRLGERCTVFMENSLMANLQRGAQKDDLLGGLAYSIVQNYINRVVAGKPIGKTIFFQGGVAFNKSVVAAFEKYLGRQITVPPHHDVTGAIGMALIARDHMNNRCVSSPRSTVMMHDSIDAEEPAAVGHRRESTGGCQVGEVTPKRVAAQEGCGSEGPVVTSAAQTLFKGFGLSERPFEISSFECKGCPNVCEINRVKVAGESGYLFYGGRCEKYDVRRTLKGTVPDLFAFREEALWHDHHRYAERLSDFMGTTKRGLKIGIPYIFFFHDCLPFWSALLWELGFEVVVSPRANKQVITLGVENVLSEACFPVKVAHGHVKYLVDEGVNAVFLPSFININRGDDEYQRGEACPYTQTIPYLSRAAIRGLSGLGMVTPIVDFARGEEFLRKEVYRSLKRFGVRKGEIAKAFDRAQISQERFKMRIRERGREVMESLTAGEGAPSVVIIGRGYNAFDSGMNLEIPRKLSTIDVLSIPMDFLPLGREKLGGAWPNMYWRSGQRILKAARIVRSTPGLFAIYIGNFSCGPDSFILKYFREEMEGKPFLHIEIDEHSADAGAVTRCEAFLDSVRQQTGQGTRLPAPGDEREAKTAVSGDVRHAAYVKRGVKGEELRKRTIYFPRMSDHTLAIKAAFEHCGINAEVLPESDSESVEIGKRYVSGKECYPYLITVGDMLKKAFSPDFRPERSVFMMPSGTGPCRFGQYNVSQRLVLKSVGLGDVPIFSPNQDAGFYEDLGIAGSEFTMKAWRGIIAYELLTKCLHETRPYEICPGETDALYNRFETKIYEALRSSNGALDHLLLRMPRDFEAIPRRSEKRPLIGVIGEIFVRSHRFSNENLVRKLESLGGEVWLAPVEEWIYYVNEMSMRKALIKKDRSAIMSILLKRYFQKRVEHSYGKKFRQSLKTLHEPGTREILRKAAPYVHDSFEGETILSIGKAIDLIDRGSSGIVNAMPFGCMPGTIVTALLKALSKDHGVPSISIPYDGTASSTTELQLEAFMESILNR